MGWGAAWAMHTRCALCARKPRGCVPRGSRTSKKPTLSEAGQRLLSHAHERAGRGSGRGAKRRGLRLPVAEGSICVAKALSANGLALSS